MSGVGPRGTLRRILLLPRKVYDKCVPRLPHRLASASSSVVKAATPPLLISTHGNASVWLLFYCRTYFYLHIARWCHASSQLSAAISQLSAWLNYKNCIMMKVIVQRRFRFRFQFQNSPPWPNSKKHSLGRESKNVSLRFNFFHDRLNDLGLLQTYSLWFIFSVYLPSVWLEKGPSENLA